MELLFILFLFIFNIYLKKKKSKLDLYPLIVVILILYSGLRYYYGFDYENYLVHFNEINSINDVLNTTFEKGYSLLVYLFKLLGLGFNTFLLFISFTSIKLKTAVFKKLSVLPDVSLLLYFLLFYVFNDVEQIRHGISIGFCFYSIIYFLEDNPKSKIYSFLLIVLGILFHTSAILFIPIYFIKDKIYNKKLYISLFGIAILLSFVDYFSLLSFVNELFLHSNYIREKIALYTTDRQSFISLTLICKIFILIIFYLYAFDYKDKLHRLLFNIYYIGVLYTILLCNVPILMTRGTSFMRYAELLMIPIYLNNIKKLPDRKIHIVISVIIFSYYFIKFITALMNPEYYYYTSI